MLPTIRLPRLQVSRFLRTRWRRESRPAPSRMKVRPFPAFFRSGCNPQIHRFAPISGPQWEAESLAADFFPSQKAPAGCSDLLIVYAPRRTACPHERPCAKDWLPFHKYTSNSVSYTHLTLPTNREV